MLGAGHDRAHRRDRRRQDDGRRGDRPARRAAGPTPRWCARGPRRPSSRVASRSTATRSSSPGSSRPTGGHGPTSTAGWPPVGSLAGRAGDLVDLHGQHAHQSLLATGGPARRARPLRRRRPRAAARRHATSCAASPPSSTRSAATPGPRPGGRPAALPGGRARGRRPRRSRRGRAPRRRGGPAGRRGRPPGGGGARPPSCSPPKAAPATGSARRWPPSTAGRRSPTRWSDSGRRRPSWPTSSADLRRGRRDASRRIPSASRRSASDASSWSTSAASTAPPRVDGRTPRRGTLADVLDVPGRGRARLAGARGPRRPGRSDSTPTGLRRRKAEARAAAAVAAARRKAAPGLASDGPAAPARPRHAQGARSR